MTLFLEQLRELDTTCVSDAMDRLGLTGGLLGIRPVLPGQTICGEAFTVHYVPCGAVKGTVGDFLDDVLPGQVVVIDNGGRLHCTVWGDIMSVAAAKKGVAGAVIDGVCRDVPAVQRSGFPIYSKGVYMVTGKDRVEVDAVNVPVSVSDVQIRPGDIILGDDSGVIAIPQDKAADILPIAQEIDRTEQAIIGLVTREGLSLREARARLGYHKLQTKV